MAFVINRNGQMQSVDADGDTPLICAVDCGTVVNPDAVEAQIQSANHVRHHRRALWRNHAEGRQGRAYQLRHLPSPAHERGAGRRGPHRPEFRAAGRDGAAGASAIVPAVTNAIFAATGKRIRKLPIDATALMRAL